MRLRDDAPICAIATAPGKGAIGVVRVSGRSLGDLDRRLTGRSLAERVATYGAFLDDDGSTIDVGLALRFAAPRSFTGEHVIELQGHGGPVVMQMLLQRVLRAGADIGVRLAEPGEFTERAFLNDKIDLAQAEAVADLIDASTALAARSAVRSLQGVFSTRVGELAADMVSLRMLVEATLDFPEEEIEFLEAAGAVGRLDAMRERVAALLATASQGALLRDGLTVVLAGAPNVGKSSLLNALAGDEVAIVTPIAGTTRDKVVQAIDVRGVPLNIVDTAGLRDTDDEVERIGIARSWRQIEAADVVLHLVSADTTGEPAVADAGLAARIEQALPAGARRIVVVNKIDLAGAGVDPSGLLGTAGTSGPDGDRPAACVRLSALTGEGIEALRDALLSIARFEPGAEQVFAARERHLQALRESAVHLDGARTQASKGDAALELVAEELRGAHLALQRITGEVTADDLLGVIFSRFCIGK
ncbi:MAG: tRNA uridine-5-carboxymethylaminomethyl(34) synthesis GTPase MnmE [Lautropia sp.]